MKRATQLAGVFLLTVLVLAGTLRAADDELDRLIKEAQASEDHQAELYAKVIACEVELSRQAYSAGKLQQALAALREASAYADDLLASAKKYHKHLKKAEITLRETSRTLQSLQQTLDLEDQPPVTALIDHIEQVRSQVLQIMFAPPEKRK